MGNSGTIDHVSDAERRRQRAVESLGLRRQREERFDRITRLARTVFDVDWTSITVVEQERAWFPSAQGFDLVDAPREDTFCDRPTLTGRTTLVEDATLDPEFADLPAVRESGIRFYAGVPLHDSTGNTVGVFCLYDEQPRTLSPDELQTLADLAAWAQQELVASGEMTRAGEVQASLLPSRPVRTEDWELDGVCLPALAVGGDLFDYAVTDEVAHFGLADVMGKGTGAALLGAGVRAAVRNTHAAVVAGVDLGITTTQVARSLAPDLVRAESFVTLFEAAIDLDDGYLRYVDAGMGLCLVVRADGRVERLSTDGLPMGVLADDHWVEHHTTLEPGDRLLLFSDGLLDLIEEPESWWVEIGELVAGHTSARDVLDAVVRLATEQVPLDDVTAVAVYRRAGTPA